MKQILVVTRCWGKKRCPKNYWISSLITSVRCHFSVGRHGAPSITACRMNFTQYCSLRVQRTLSSFISVTLKLKEQLFSRLQLDSASQTRHLATGLLIHTVVSPLMSARFSGGNREVILLLAYYSAGLFVVVVMLLNFFCIFAFLKKTKFKTGKKKPCGEKKILTEVLN